MMRLRGASIAAALLAVLTLTAAALAECRWVLWRWDFERTTRPQPNGRYEKETWTPSSALYSEEQCQNRESYENTSYAKYRETLPVEQRASHDRSWLCLPTGADPHHLTKSTVHRAKAACGWVLWQQEVFHPAKDNETITWLPVGGGDTQGACQSRAKFENGAWARYQERSLKDEAEIKDQSRLDLARRLHDVDRVWLCAPVGTDPRGAKGK